MMIKAELDLKTNITIFFFFFVFISHRFLFLQVLKFGRVFYHHLFSMDLVNLNNNQKVMERKEHKNKL